MKIFYQAENWRRLVQLLERSHQALSRTRQGRSDTKASASKHPLLLSGEALAERSRENAHNLYTRLLTMVSQPPPASASEVADRIGSIEEEVNRGLLPQGRLRTWQPSYAESDPFADKIPFEQIPVAMDDFARTMYERWGELSVDPYPMAAWAEWSIQGPLHPYYDGCGRISRGLSAWLLTWAGAPVPLYTSREDWFASAHQGLDSFFFPLSRVLPARSGGTALTRE